jgi:cysteine desulfurase family protein (TIGR01976 family)
LNFYPPYFWRIRSFLSAFGGLGILTLLRNSEVSFVNEFIDYVRKQFPSLKMKINGFTAAFLDGPGGYQVPRATINAMENYLINMNANCHGAYLTSQRTDEMLQSAREGFADFFNCSYAEVAFGANMTTLSFSLAQALMREMSAGDKVLITEMDHDANRAPWIELQERGVVVENVVADANSCTLDMDDFKKKLTANTKVVACNYAQNAVGTISDVGQLINLAHEEGAYTVVDAVHYAAHRPTDVNDIDADFLICSAYKFFGPHIGILYAKKDTLGKLQTMRVRSQKSYPPYMIETGTLNHEGIAGAKAAIEFVTDIGSKFGNTTKIQQQVNHLHGRRRDIVAGLIVFDAYEQPLTEYLIQGLSDIPEITLYGPPEGHPRTSTVSFTYDGHTAPEVARYLAEKGLFVWAGDFYASTLIDRLGLRDRGGLVRIGIAPYNTKDELSRVIEALKNGIVPQQN